MKDYLHTRPAPPVVCMQGNLCCLCLAETVSGTSSSFHFVTIWSPFWDQFARPDFIFFESILISIVGPWNAFEILLFVFWEHFDYHFGTMLHSFGAMWGVMAHLRSLLWPHSAKSSKTNGFPHELLTHLETLFEALGALFPVMARPSAEIRGI